MTEQTQITQTQKVIIDLVEKNIIPLFEGDDFFEKIDWQIGKPGRGDQFQLAIQTVSGEMDKMRIPGSDLFEEVFRPNLAEAQYEILETWQWTGRQWKQI